VVIIHEEAINQFPGMAYFGRLYSGDKVSLRAMDYFPEYPYAARATVDEANHWKLRNFSQFSMVHLVLSCIEQYFRWWC
jgi:hypothetical protein